MSHTLPFIFLLLLLLPGAHPGLSPASTPPISSGEPDPTAQASQMVLVLTPGWDSTTGRLACFERILLGDPWKEVGEPCEINIGRTGLAWGLGLHGGALGDGPVKREGDGRSPAQSSGHAIPTTRRLPQPAPRPASSRGTASSPSPAVSRNG